MTAWLGLLLVMGQTTWTEQGLLTDTSAFQFERFGAAVAVEGDVAVVGAPGAWPSGVQRAGEVFVYQRAGTTWTQVQRLNAVGSGTDARFGASVALSGDLLAVGAPGAETAFLFKKVNGTWTQVVNLGVNSSGRYPASRLANDDFGTAVAVGPGMVVVGAPNHDFAKGTSYVFFEDTGDWRLVVRRSGSALVAGSRFGSAVSLRSGTVAIGSNGAAYLFAGAGTSISEAARLVTGSGTPQDGFGTVVSLFSTTSLAVGAPYTEVAGTYQQGVAYIFDYVSTAGWQERARLEESDGGVRDYFGQALAASGDTLLVGVPGDAPAGSARVYVRDGASWSQQAVLLPGSAALELGGTPSFGTSVGLWGDTGLVGAPENDAARGAALVVVRARVVNGGACALPSDCASGFCVDGVCCDTACGGGATNDCQACSVSAGTAVSGTCGALTVDAAAVTVCRAKNGACDVADSCVAGSTSCPPNGYAPNTTLCRAAAGPCDVAEYCSGTSASCRSNSYASATTECRPAAGPCDVAELCPGNASACPADGFAASSVECRAQAGECDVAESCTGSGAACPEDGFAGSSTVCRPSAGACDVVERCSGASGACPGDLVQSAGSVCAAPSCSLGVEAHQSVCDGLLAACPAQVLLACSPYACGPSACKSGCLPGECAAGYACVSGACVVVVDAGPVDAGVAAQDAGVVDAGRPDGGPLDAGVADAGRPDAGAPDAGMSDAGRPDAGLPDAGRADAGPPSGDGGAPDAGAGSADGGAPAPADAGLPPIETPPTGCGCQAASPALVSWGLLAWAVLRGRRRR